MSPNLRAFYRITLKSHLHLLVQHLLQASYITRLEAPVALDQVTCPSSNTHHKGLRAPETNWSANTHTLLFLQSQFRVQNPHHEQRAVQICQHLSVRTVQFRNRTNHEGEGDGFDEIGVGARGDLELIAIGGGWVAGAVTDPFLGVEAVEDDAVREEGEVGGEGQGEAAGYGEELGDWDADAEGR